MSNLFDQAIKIAIERQQWEAEVNPSGETFLLRGFSEAELDQSQKHIDDFNQAVAAIAKKGGFKKADDVRSELIGLDHETQKRPLVKMAEMCIRIEPATMAIAEALAPVRVQTVARIKAGHFGVPETPEEAAIREAMPGTQIHKANPVEQGRAVTKDDFAAKTMEQSAAFDKLNGVMGIGSKPSAKKTREDAGPGALARLGGVKMVEGERVVVAPVTEPLPKGQMKLFGEEQAPIPEDAAPPKKRSPRGRA